MSTTHVRRAPLPTDIDESPSGINNFTIVAATVNGSGSQTANQCLLRAIFKMGIPASGKNIFPSNIQGLPTWFSIRVSREGFIARRETAEIVVALNRQTAADDIAGVPLGGVVIYPTEWKLSEDRDDITYYSLPVQQMAKDSGANADLRPYVANMVYVGALTELLGIDVEEIKAALADHFQGKQKPIDLNFGVVQAAIDYTRANITKRDPFRIERMRETAGKIMMTGDAPAARLAGRGADGLLWGPRRHAPRAALPGLDGRLLRVWLARFRSGRALADPHLRAERPRPRHESLDERAFHLSRPADGSRQSALGGRAAAAPRLPSL